MARRGKTIGLPIINSRAGAIDIGSRFHVVAVPAEMHEEPVQTFQAFTGDLHRMADWLRSVGARPGSPTRWTSTRDRCCIRLPEST